MAPVPLGLVIVTVIVDTPPAAIELGENNLEAVKAVCACAAGAANTAESTRVALPRIRVKMLM